MMKKKIIRVVYDDLTQLEYDKELYFDYYSYEDEIIKSLKTDIEDWAKIEYGLSDEDECDNSMKKFADYEIYEEAERRDLIKDIQEEGIQNVNIMNETFLDRFINIMNRGENSEIEKAIEKLESKFKIG